MPNISVKDVPNAWAEALRQRAVRNHRSLQGELMAIIERAVAEPAQPELALPVPAPWQPAASGGGGGAGLQVGDFIFPAHPQVGWVVGFDRNGEAIVRRGWKSAAQIASEMQAQYPADSTGSSSADMVRTDRDSR